MGASGSVGGGPQQCALCHLQWVDEFTGVQPGAAPLLIDRPARPIVGEDRACLGCHDGSVADSRKLVWRDHGHKTGVAVPADMAVPAALPLTNGRIACSTCHSAHNGRGDETLGNAVFLRLAGEGDGEGLCRSCHAREAAGPPGGSHPMGRLAARAEAPGPAQGKGPTLTCRACHAPHGGGQNHLLIVAMGADGNALCLSCHERDKFDPAAGRSADRGRHPIADALLTAAQAQAVRDMGGQAPDPPSRGMACLTCHQMHRAKSKRAILADTLADSKLCARCHAGQATVLGSAHDLRALAASAEGAAVRPSEAPSAGDGKLTAAERGPCGACHGVHSRPQPPRATAMDPSGACSACHGPGGVAEKNAPAFDHPIGALKAAAAALGQAVLAAAPAERGGGDAESGPPPSPDAGGHGGDKAVVCLSCHNPHDARHADFLRNDPDQLCAKCHAAEAASLAGAHDYATHPKARNSRGRTAAEVGRCGFCHAIHRPETAPPAPALLSAATAQPIETADEMCTACHRPGGPAAGEKAAAPAVSHPTGPKTASLGQVLPFGGAALPLFDASARRVAGNKEGFVACPTCHNVHGDSRSSGSLLRRQDGQQAGHKPVSDLCASCHLEQSAMARGQHDPRSAKRWPGGGDKAAGRDLCMTCHKAHSDDPKRGLWAVAPAAGPTAGSGNDPVCTACHPAQGWADPGKPTAVGMMLHPRTAPRKGSPASDAAKAAAEPIACATCHNPHAPLGTAALLRTAGSLDPATLCVRCHAEARAVEQSPHSGASLAAATGAKPASVCGPCHAVHAVEGSAKAAGQSEQLWALPVADVKGEQAEKRCLVCHGPGGKAKQVALVDHPKVTLPAAGAGQGANAATETARGEQADEEAGGQHITCQTCHLAHGRGDVAAVLPGQEGVAQAFRNASRPMVRPDAARVNCAACHGPDALRRFLYYHQPDKRKRTHFWVSPAPEER